MAKNNPFGTGRIEEIVEYIKQNWGIENILQLSAKEKLDILCDAMQLTPGQFDKLIASNSPVLRTIQGHAFEVAFDRMIIDSGYEVQEVGGDDDVDRIINGFALQLKTPNAGGTRGNQVEYKTHKTHGAKSELESMEYYHSIDTFADYLVGLISYRPLRIIFLNKDELPRHLNDHNRILSPFRITWEGHQGLNAFQRIGIKRFQVNEIATPYLVSNKELLSLSANKVGLSSDVILSTILNPKNFRIWDMSIRGFAKEVAFTEFLNEHGVINQKPDNQYRVDGRANKSDLMLITTKGELKFLQVKGLSVNNCKFAGRSSVVAVETQLTRGRVNDHPTQSRLYLNTDFDYLIIGIDPSLVQKYHVELNLKPDLAWEFYAIPTSVLENHSQMPHRLKSLQTFKYLDIQDYLVDANWFSDWRKLQ